MSKVAKIHQGKSPVRRHFLAEWLAAKGMSEMDLVAALNDPERSMDLNEIDKSQVYRWVKGQLPQPATQVRLAAALGFDDPGMLMRHPDDDWFSRLIQDRSRDEVERVKQAIALMLPPKTGTGS